MSAADLGFLIFGIILLLSAVLVGIEAAIAPLIDDDPLDDDGS